MNNTLVKCLAAAVAAVAMAADAHANAAEWERMTAESRPQMPNAKTRAEYRQRKADESATRSRLLAAGAPYAEAKAAAERTLGFALPEDAEWRTPYESEDERVEVVEFTDAAGAVNRFALFEQLGVKFPYWWSVEGASPETLIASAPAVSAFDGVLERRDTEIIEMDAEVQMPYERFRLYFLDDAPNMDWIRPCRYLFVPEDGSGYTVLYRKLPPRIWTRGTDEELFMTPLRGDEAQEVSKPESLADVTNSVYSRARRLRAATPNLNFSRGYTSHSYFVLFSGGGDAHNNRIRYWCDTAMLYSTLTLKYGVSKDHIYVYMSDGTSSGKDANLADSTSDVLVDSPRDLDGDGNDDVDGPADMTTLSNCFANLTRTLTETDQLFFFATGHGSPVGAASTANRNTEILLWSSGKTFPSFSDEDFSNWTKGIKCPMAVALEPCYSGGFIDDVTATKDRVIATACRYYETSNGKVGGGAWRNNTAGMTKSANPWALQLISAFRGVRPNNLDADDYPWHDSDTLTDADSNSDRLVSFKEAADYANENDTTACRKSSHSWSGDDRCLYVSTNGVEHPCYGESASGVGSSFYVLKQNWLVPSSTSLSLDPASGASASLTVRGSCSWTVSYSASWLTVSPPSGSNSGAVITCTATSANSSISKRTATVYLRSSGISPQISRTIYVTQGGKRPANDDFEDAYAVSGANFWTVGVCSNATYQAGEPKFKDSATNTVWWAFTPQYDGKVQMNTKGSTNDSGGELDTVMAVYTGGSLSSLTRVCGNDDIGGGVLASSNAFTVALDTVYYIQISGYNASKAGRVRLNVSYTHYKVTFDTSDCTCGETERYVAASGQIGTLPTPVRDGYVFKGWRRASGSQVYSTTTITAATILYASWVPANDCYEGSDSASRPTVLTGVSGSAQGVNSSATVQSGEPLPQYRSAATNTVWWTWTAPMSGNVVFDTAGSYLANPELTMDTLLGVYTYSGGVWTTIAVNDDVDGSNDRTSRVSFSATKGVTYHICVGGYGKANVGTILLNWTERPANDDFASAQTISGLSGSLSCVTSNATVEVGEPLPQYRSAATGTVWWRWVAPVAGVAVFDTAGSTIGNGVDTILGVYTYSDGAWTTVSENDDVHSTNDRTSRVEFTAENGVTYYICASGYNAPGTIRLNWMTVLRQYKIRFIRNDGAGTMETREFDHGVSTPLPTIASLGFARRGMVFKGWATSSANAAAGKIWKTDGAVVATPTAADTTMDAIAVWALADGYYGIKFNKNDGTGKWRSAAYKYGDVTTLPSCGAGLGWTRDGYTFKGWATSAANASAGVVWKADRGTVQTGISAGTTQNVYAIWEALPKYTIKYGKYDGTGETFSSNYVWGVESHVPTATKGPLFWQRTGFDWLGWATSPANADAGKVWKAGWGSISKPVDAGETLSVYACWRLQSGYYAIKFFRNDGTAAWRSKAFQHGVATRLPSMANGLRWSRAGYAFAGWATSAAKAAAGTVYRADWGIVTAPVAEGQTLTLYAIWRPIASANQVKAARSASAGVSHAVTGDVVHADGAVQSAAIVVPPATIAPGYYIGRLADGSGAYELIVGDDQEAGIVRIDFDSGESFFAEVEVVMFTDAAIVIATEDGDIYWLLQSDRSRCARRTKLLLKVVLVVSKSPNERNSSQHLPVNGNNCLKTICLWRAG